MKVALLISGHMRTFEKTHQSLKRNVIDKFNCDVFVSTWTNVGNILYQHYTPGFDEADEKIDANRVEAVYSPKLMVIENSSADYIKLAASQFEELKTRNGSKIGPTVTMFYKMWNCNKLKNDFENTHGVKYDITIRCRPDVYIKNLDLEKGKEKIQFLPGHCGFNDLVFFGPSEAMNDVFELFTILNPGIPFGQIENAENLLFEHVKNNDIPNELSVTVDYLFVKPHGAYDFQGKKICEFNELED